MLLTLMTTPHIRQVSDRRAVSPHRESAQASNTMGELLHPYAIDLPVRKTAMPIRLDEAFMMCIARTFEQHLPAARTRGADLARNIAHIDVMQSCSEANLTGSFQRLNRRRGDIIILYAGKKRLMCQGVPTLSSSATNRAASCSFARRR